MVLKRPPTSALSIFAIAVLISVVRVTASAANGTATANPTTNVTITVQPSTTPNITVQPSTSLVVDLQPSINATSTVMDVQSSINATSTVMVVQSSINATSTVMDVQSSINTTSTVMDVQSSINATSTVMVVQSSINATSTVMVVQSSINATSTVMDVQSSINATSTVMVVQSSINATSTVMDVQSSINATSTVMDVQSSINATSTVMVVQSSINATSTVMDVQSSINTTSTVMVVQSSINATSTVMDVQSSINATSTVMVVQSSINATSTVMDVQSSINATSTVMVVQSSINATSTVMDVQSSINATSTVMDVQSSINATSTVMDVQSSINATSTVMVVQSSINATSTVMDVQSSINATSTVMVVQSSINATSTVMDVQSSINATSTVMDVQPSINATSTVMDVQPSINTTSTVLDVQSSINATSTVMVVQSSINTTSTVMVVQPSINATSTVMVVQPSINATSTVMVVQPSINATSTVMVVQPSTYTTMMSYTTSVLTMPKITPSPSPTSKVPTVTSSRAVEIPNTKYYEYSAKFTLTNITKSGLKNPRDSEILDRLITNCTDEYTEENSIEYQKFEKYMQKEICGIFESSSQSCFLQITSMKCGSIITEFNVTLEVNSTQSNNITNGTAFSKVEEIIKNGTLGAFVTNTSSFTSNFYGEVNKRKDVSPTSTMMTTRPMTTRPMRRPTITPTPTTTRKQQVVSTSSIIPKTSNKTFQYEISFTITNIHESHVSEENFIILHLLITKCNDEYIEKNSIQFITFQRYFQKEICASIYNSSSSEECSVTVEELNCGSLKIQAVVELKDNSIKLIEDKVKEGGSLGGLIVIKTSFSSKYTGEITPKPTRKPPQAEPEVYVIVTMKYSWKEFCVVETHFKETIAERSYDIKGKPLTPNNIYIINREHCRDKNFGSTEEEIQVRFTVIAEEQNEATIQVGKDLIDLVDSRQTRKLGNLLEDKIVKVELGGVKAPQLSGRSDTEKIWLAVGISLGAIVLLILLYFCCCRQSEKESDTERGMTNLFLMGEMDSSKKETTELVNEGFDDQDGTDTPLSHRISTFKDNAENGNKPITKSSSDDVSASVAADNDSIDAPLGEGEDTDDELGMTVADVAIEPESEEEKKGATPPGTLPIIPPDPTHMAIKDLPTFLEESGKENEKNKEYEDLDQSMTLLNTYPSNTQDRNRSAALVPKPETRVKLGGENDYINANFVKDHNGKNNFIATQHPLSNTMRDFWTMVWDQDVSVVVMVNEKEKDLENYHNYWLDHKNSLTIYGHMQVKTEKMEALPGYSLTKFVLQNSQESNVTKAVNHYRFTNWTENGIPNVKEFAGFIKSVEKARLENLQQPIVVHCSGGQGYTGVAIAANIGLRVYNESDKKSIINVFDCVEKMRKDRNGIVCSKDMYNFIFKVLFALTDTKESSDSKL